MMIKRKEAMLICAVLFCFGLVGSMDYQDQLDEERIYTEMVCEGTWPDYDNRKPDCSKLEKKDG